MSSNRPEWVVAVQAIWRLGAAVVLFSPAWKQAETEHAIANPRHAVGEHPVLASLMPMLHLDELITARGDMTAEEQSFGTDDFRAIIARLG